MRAIAVCSNSERVREQWRRRMPNAEIVARRAADAAIGGASAKPSFSMSVLLADDDETRSLNRRFRSRDKPADVLSFPAPEGGDVAVSLQALLRQSMRDNLPKHAYLGWLVIHGTLHLCGFDHRSDGDAARMRSLERRLMKETFNLEPPKF